MDKRPHILTWTPVGPAGEDPVTGYPVEGVPGEPISVPCRFHSGGGKSSIKEFKNEDNTVVKQVGLIRIDAGSEAPVVGQEVKVTEEAMVLFSGVIRGRYFGGQLGKWRLDV